MSQCSRVSKQFFTLLLAVSSLSLAAAARPATAAPATDASFHADAEIDPTAYALSGNSLHVGIGWRRVRVDLGNFAIRLPQFVHGDDGFDVSFAGFGAKLQLFPFAEQRGLFVGVDVGLGRVLVQRQGTDLAAQHHQFGAGVNVGYRIALPASFYVTPWIGIGYEFGADDVTLGGSTYEASALNIFPAIHLGYRFR
jgi:hypothetical protein